MYNFANLFAFLPTSFVGLSMVFFLKNAFLRLLRFFMVETISPLVSKGTRSCLFLLQWPYFFSGVLLNLTQFLTSSLPNWSVSGRLLKNFLLLFQFTAISLSSLSTTRCRIIFFCLLVTSSSSSSRFCSILASKKIHFSGFVFATFVI